MLYLVWQQSRGGPEPYMAPVGFGDLFGSLSAPGDNILAVKTTFWISTVEAVQFALPGSRLLGSCSGSVQRSEFGVRVREVRGSSSVVRSADLQVRPEEEDHMRRMRICRCWCASAFLASLGLAAQSPTPFGIPSTDQPTPAATIPAVPGSRAQGLAGAGAIGSARAPRGRGDQRSAGRAGRPRDHAAGRQRDRRRRRGGRGARRHLAERHRDRRRSVRAGLVGSRQEALRARLGRLGARRLDAAVLHRPPSRQERARTAA